MIQCAIVLNFTNCQNTCFPTNQWKTKHPPKQTGSTLGGVSFKRRFQKWNCFTPGRHRLLLLWEKRGNCHFIELNSWYVGRGLSSPGELREHFTSVYLPFLLRHLKPPRCKAANGWCKSLDFFLTTWHTSITLMYWRSSGMAGPAEVSCAQSCDWLMPQCSERSGTFVRSQKKNVWQVSVWLTAGLLLSVGLRWVFI